MLTYVIQKQIKPKFLLMNVFYFAFFMFIYTLVDSLNMSYEAMNLEFGFGLVITNIALNIIMALLSMVMLGLTSAQFDLSGKESNGSNLSIASVFFGILTYGCTPCVIAFFAAIGISFSVIALPFAGLPYKFISLAILLIGLIWVIRSIQKTTCPIPTKKS
jgi:hypothetical protein